ncbi:hypothetical protein [Nonomuraea angiospora]|uniref:hypothetical protein n=1 Tax=Nonomuraea angiospora TaxID=46172 RepID=UPI0029BE477F|nr:hypothetical protein [Nonomuraea angiospora]MDX3107439.1 hypothetical protein [Nonomuraea angiospora]
MRVELTAAVLKTDVHAEDVIVLLRHFRKGRHEWAVTPLLVDVAESFIDRHVPQRESAYKQLIRKAAQQYAYRTTADPPAERISPEDIEDIVEDLNRPAVLVVESNDSDKLFIRAVAKALGALDIIDAIDNDWLAVGHGGGGDTHRRAREEHESFRRIKRAAALFDSDRWAPGTPEKNAHRIQELRMLGIKIHVLTLREAENYIPNRVLRAVKPYRESSVRLSHLRELTLDQRGHYDMKHGFKKTRGIPEQQQQLFAGAPPDALNGLDQGFGQALLQVFESMADRLTEADFARDVGEAVPDELRGLVAMLREIL